MLNSPASTPVPYIASAIILILSAYAAASSFRTIACASLIFYLLMFLPAASIYWIYDFPSASIFLHCRLPSASTKTFLRIRSEVNCSAIAARMFAGGSISSRSTSISCTPQFLQVSSILDFVWRLISSLDASVSSSVN